MRSQGEAAAGGTLFAVDAGRGPVSLRAQWVGAGWPEDVRAALEGQGEGPWPAELVLLAREFSPGAIEVLAARSANWADESGAARISAPGLLVIRDGSRRPPPRRVLGWSASAVDIAELLLSQGWPEGFGTAELANKSGWSAPQVSQVLRLFDDEGWTSKYGPGRGRGAKRELVDSDGLLRSWSEAMADRPTPVREASRTVADPIAFLADELAPSLADNVRWALGGWAAADEVAPFLTSVPTLQIHVHEDDFRGSLTTAMYDSGLREVEEGGRVQFRSAPASAIARSWSPSGRFPLASTPRIYVDLQRLGPRGSEAAEHLKEEAIDPLHRQRAEAGGPSQGLEIWELETKARLEQRLATSPVPGIRDRYRHGTYSAGYLLRGVEAVSSLPDFKRILEESVGRETGWPPWLVTAGSRSYEDTIEAWFEDTVFNDPAHSDFWRADPRGRLCLIRGYDEDSRGWPFPPGSTLDLTLPIWRVGECVLHAHRLASRLGASRIEFMMRWEGLEGRELVDHLNLGHLSGEDLRCRQGVVVNSIEAMPASLDSNLEELVSFLIAPLYAAFGFRLPEGLVAEQLAKVRGKGLR